jgi:hypothetical protein
MPILGAQDCPVCCARDYLLVRSVHSHFCNLCAGDWDHGGLCLDGVAAWCPWCFPKLHSTPAPGARRGPHFHYCPECGQNWRHEAACSAPLRVVLPDCPGCLPPPMPAHPHAGRTLLVHLAATVLLSMSFLLTGSSALRSPALDAAAPVLELRREVYGPVGTPTAPALTVAALDATRMPPTRGAVGPRQGRKPALTITRGHVPTSDRLAEYVSEAAALRALPPVTDLAPTPSESETPATSVQEAVPSIPGAPPLFSRQRE